MDSASRESATVDDVNKSSFFSIHVEITTTISSGNSVPSAKSFNTNGKEYPMRRFGSWVFRTLSDEEARDNLLINGGLPVVLTWAIFQKYDDTVTVWVSDPDHCRFVFEINKSEQSRILGDISDGRVSCAADDVLKSMTSPSYCENTKIKLIKIIRDHGSGDKAKNGVNCKSESLDNDNMRKLQEAEKVAHHMKGGQYSLALSILKQSLARGQEDTFRLQLLIRAYICATHLKTEEEAEEYFPRLIAAMKTAQVPPSEIILYADDYKELFNLLVSNGSVTEALEIGFAFQKFISNVMDVVERLEASADNIQRLCNGIKSILRISPGVCLKAESRNYIKRVHDEIDCMKKSECDDTLVHAQCVYYCEFALDEVKKSLDQRIGNIFNDASVEFKRLSSCWADFPFVLTRLRRHPKISKYLKDDDYVSMLRKISAKPSMLERYIKDPKIVEAHEILTSEFGLLDGIVIEKEESHNETTPLNSKAAAIDNQTKQEETMDPKVASKEERKRGHDAHKRLSFTEAHQHYNRAIQLDPSNAMIYWNKAAVFISEKNYGLAERACLHALNSIQQNSARYSPQDIAKILARGARVQFLSNELVMALPLYQLSLNIHHDPKVVAEMTKCQEAIGSRRQ